MAADVGDASTRGSDVGSSHERATQGPISARLAVNGCVAVRCAAKLVGSVGVDRAGAVDTDGAAVGEEVSELVTAALDA